MIDAIVAREIKKTKLKKNILIPEIKIKTNQLKPIKRVWPISGWSIKRLDIKIVNKKDKKYFKLKLVYFWEQIIKLKKFQKKTWKLIFNLVGKQISVKSLLIIDD